MPDSVLRMDALLTLSEASGLLRLKTSTLRAWVLRRKIPYVKVGRLVRVRRVDVEGLIAANVVPARTERETEHERQSSQFLAQS